MQASNGNRRGEESPDAVSGPVDDVPLDTVYDILRNERRRLVLHYLVNAPDHRAVIGTLATQIAAWENGVPVSAVTSKLRKRTYNTLQQTHLSKMDDAGLVDYDRSRGTVELTASPGQLELFLKVLPRTDGDRTGPLLLAGFVLWLLLAANWLAVHAMELYDPGTVTPLTGVTLLLVLVGLVHVYRIVR
jgi:hypothetical protein